MELSPPDSSNYHCCKHLAANRHPSGRPMQDKNSLLVAPLQLTLIVALAMAASAAMAQTPTTPSGTGTSIGSSPQSATSAIPASSPFLGGTPSGKATADTLPLTLRDAIDRGLRYNLGLVFSGISSRSAR